MSDPKASPEDPQEDVLELEVPDPGTLPGESPGAEAPPAEEESPYRNLLVPLVVVPALIVMVLVLIFVMFGAIAGEEDSPRENLDRLLNGGFNERQQAAFTLVRQVLDHEHARREGREPEWDIDASFLPELKAARETFGDPDEPGEVTTALVLSSLLAQLGEPDGVYQLIDLTQLPAELDPEGETRMSAAWTLGAIGDELEEAERRLSARALIELLGHEDAGLALAAAAGLQNLPSEGTTAALTGLLGHASLEMRGTAALSLAHLGEAAGAEVLASMTGPEPYEAERASAPAKWPPKRVSESRIKALAALGSLGLPPEAAVLEALAEDDPDGNVRAAARELLAGRGVGGGDG